MNMARRALRTLLRVLGILAATLVLTLVVLDLPLPRVIKLAMAMYTWQAVFSRLAFGRWFPRVQASDRWTTWAFAALALGLSSGVLQARYDLSRFSPVFLAGAFHCTEVAVRVFASRR
jgi:hypothetical protein